MRDTSPYKKNCTEMMYQAFIVAEAILILISARLLQLLNGQVRAFCNIWQNVSAMVSVFVFKGKKFFFVFSFLIFFFDITVPKRNRLEKYRLFTT